MKALYSRHWKEKPNHLIKGDNMSPTDGSEEIIEIKAVVPVNEETGLLAPKDLDGYWRMAQMLADSGMVPEEYARKPQAIIVATQMGKELGLSTNQSLQSITVIKGKPSVYADGLTGLLNGSGLVEDWKERFVMREVHLETGEIVSEREVDPSDLPLNLEEWPDNLKAESIIIRKNRKTPSKGVFSVADAKRQGTWNKPNKKGKSVWQKHPARMLMWRARTYAARDGFSDVLKGLHVFEEVIDYDADLEESNGHYEVKESPTTPTTPTTPDTPFDEGFMLFCSDNDINPSDAIEFVKVSAEATEAPIDIILADAYQRKDDFISKLAVFWQEKNGKLLSPEIENQEDPPERVVGDPEDCAEMDAVAQMDNTEAEDNTMGDEGPFQDPPPPEIDEDGFSADMDPEKKSEMIGNDVETPEIRMNSQMYALFKKAGKDASKMDYPAILARYVDYVSELTKQPREGLVEKFASTDTWFDFFLGWIDTDFNPNRAADKSASEGSESDGAETESEGQSSDRDQGAGKTPPEAPAPVSPGKSTIKKWIGMRGVDFEPYVEKNPDDFVGIPAEEYDRAVAKWNQLVYKRTKKPWPGLPGDKKQEAREGASVEFPELNARQILLKVKKKYPNQSEAARLALGFATHVTSDESAELWIAATRFLVEGGSTKALKDGSWK